MHPTLLLALLLTLQPQGDPVKEAAAYLDAGRPEPAISLLRTFLEQQPGHLPARFHLALAQAMAGQSQEAIADFRKVLEGEPGLYEAQLNLGQLLVQTGQHAEAAGWLEKAASQRPAQPRPHLFLARAFAGQSKWGDAATELKKARELDPSLQELELELADYLDRSGQPAEAIPYYRRHLDVPAARERVALHYLTSNQPKEAIEHLEVLLKESPSSAVKYALATAYLRTGQPDRSVPLAASILEQEPGNTEIRMFLGRLFRDQKQYAKAAQQFAAVVKTRPESLEAWNELTGMLIVLEQFEPALEGLERVKQLGGETAAYHYFRALLLDGKKQYKPALESYRRFLEMSTGAHPEEEFKARQRARILERILNK
jgi:tetratricopeptide (TPR) repeat protein